MEEMKMAKILLLLFLFASHANADQCRSLLRQARINPNGQAAIWLKRIPECEEFIELPKEPVQTVQDLPQQQEPETIQGLQQQTQKSQQIHQTQTSQPPPPPEIRLLEAQNPSMTFAFIEAGTFTMGSPDGEQRRDRAAQAHEVTLTEDFEIQTTEITQRQYFEIMKKNPSFYKGQQYCENEHRVIEGVELCPNNPVEMVSWHDVQDFLAELNQSKNDGYTYRLPTTEEWEYAARAGTATAYFFGDYASEMGDYAWYSQNSRNKNFRRQTYAVGLKRPNPWRLHDVYGNVWEWVSLSSSGELASATRGNSYIGHAWQMRSASYAYKRTYPGRGLPVIGFRLVRTAN